MICCIIPSKYPENLFASAWSVMREDDALIIAVNDGARGHNPREFEEALVWVEGDKPFVFARNVNLGIKQALEFHRTGAHWVDGVVIMNDDAILRTHCGLTKLMRASLEIPDCGAISATTNVVGNPNQKPHPGIGVRPEKRMLCFVCVYIPRKTIEAVGLLDERFVDYGFEDDDYCLRIRQAGKTLWVHDGVYVDHGSLTSTFRGHPSGVADIRPNLMRFIEKWGVDNFGRAR
jgi:GT2 family glycosyltransferase